MTWVSTSRFSSLSPRYFSSRTLVPELGRRRSCQLPLASLIFRLRSALWYTNFSFARSQSPSWLPFSWQAQSSAQRNCCVSVGPVLRKQLRFCMDPTNLLWIGHSPAQSLAYWTFLKALGLRMGNLYAIYEWVTIAFGPWRRCVHEEVYGRSWRILNRSALSFTTKALSILIWGQLGGIALQFCVMFKDFWRHNEALIESWLEPSSQLINFPHMCRPSSSAWYLLEQNQVWRFDSHCSFQFNMLILSRDQRWTSNLKLRAWKKEASKTDDYSRFFLVHFSSAMWCLILYKDGIAHWVFFR